MKSIILIGLVFLLSACAAGPTPYATHLGLNTPTAQKEYLDGYQFGLMMRERAGELTEAQVEKEWWAEWERVKGRDGKFSHCRSTCTWVGDRYSGTVICKR